MHKSADAFDEVLTIGQLAKRAGVGVETVRFYEREGLIAEPRRQASSRYRQYERGAVQRLLFIRQAKELGFSLREIRELLELRVDPSSSCDDVRERAVAKIATIEARIDRLQEMKRALERLSKGCRPKAPASECPILEELTPLEPANPA